MSKSSTFAIASNSITEFSTPEEASEEESPPKEMMNAR